LTPTHADVINSDETMKKIAYLLVGQIC